MVMAEPGSLETDREASRGGVQPLGSRQVVQQPSVQRTWVPSQARLLTKVVMALSLCFLICKVGICNDT